MTTYRLPDALGGGEVREFDTTVEVPHTHRAVGFVDVTVDPDNWLFLIPRRALTEVPPPIPDEPTRWGAYLIDGHHAVRRPDGMWERPGVRGCYTSWEELLNEVADEPPEAKIVPLVPAPALPTVDREAPFEHTDTDGDRVVIRYNDLDNAVRLTATMTELGVDYIGGVDLDTPEARRGAAAAILAIDAAIERDRAARIDASC